MEDDDDDESLEVELAALAAGNDTSYKSRRNGKLVSFTNFVFYITEIIKWELSQIYNIQSILLIYYPFYFFFLYGVTRWWTLMHLQSVTLGYMAQK